MTNLFFLNQTDLRNELFANAKTEGVNSKEAFAEYAQNVVEGHRRLGEMDDDQNLEGIEDYLEQLWADYQQFIQN